MEVRKPGGMTTVGVGGAELVVVLVDEVLVVLVVVITGGTEVLVVLLVVVVVLLLVVEVEVGPGMVVTLEALTGGWPGTPRQAPNWDWHPAPQKSTDEPHQKNCEQHGP